MNSSCGQRQVNKHKFVNNIIGNAIITFQQKKVCLKTAYSGKVSVSVQEYKNGNYYLHCKVKVGDKSVYIKVIDAETFNLKANVDYTDSYLESVTPASVNGGQNRWYYYLSLLLGGQLEIDGSNNQRNFAVAIQDLQPTKQEIEKAIEMLPGVFGIKEPKPEIYYKSMYADVSKQNALVDALFNACEYVQYIYEIFGEVSIAGRSTLYFLTNVVGLDNAYFTGRYMVLGMGDSSFYPLVSSDVVGHELTHGMIQGLAGLEYVGQSGALNESFADVIGVHFEAWVHSKYKYDGDSQTNLLGNADWHIGEDFARVVPFIRDMQYPELGNQPSKYKGNFYVDPNSKEDYGGVHTNSGITNHMFFLLSQGKWGITGAAKLYIAVLRQLQPTSNFIDFRNTMYQLCATDKTVYDFVKDCLDKVGLTIDAISDQDQKTCTKCKCKIY
jgi:hypothetical protein